MINIDKSIIGRVVRGEYEGEEIIDVYADRYGFQIFGERADDPAYTVPWSVVGELLVTLATSPDDGE